MKRFLVVDDSAFMRSMMKKTLSECGYTVDGEAENGRVAIEKYKELLPDVVTMDITMSEMNGLEALEKIIEIDSKAKVIMVSAMGQATFVKEAVSLGAKGFLVKPFDKDTVFTCVERIFSPD